MIIGNDKANDPLELSLGLTDTAAWAEIAARFDIAESLEASIGGSVVKPFGQDATWEVMGVIKGSW